MAKLFFFVAVFLALGQAVLGASSTSVSTLTSTQTPATTSTSYEATTRSEADVVEDEWATLTTCRLEQKVNECNSFKDALSILLDLNKAVCAGAINYVNCLDRNCHKTQAVSDSMQRVRDRCSGAGPLQSAVLVILLMLAVHFLKF